jgi:hypothetical protein
VADRLCRGQLFGDETEDAEREGGGAAPKKILPLLPSRVGAARALEGPEVRALERSVVVGRTTGVSILIGVGPRFLSAGEAGDEDDGEERSSSSKRFEAGEGEGKATGEDSGDAMANEVTDLTEENEDDADDDAERQNSEGEIGDNRAAASAAVVNDGGKPACCVSPASELPAIVATFAVAPAVGAFALAAEDGNRDVEK